MPKMEYKKRQEEDDFSWMCSRCRQDDAIYGPDANSPASLQHSTSLKDIKSGSILHFNCRSANGKLEDIQRILHEAKPAILILTETWLDDSYPKGTLYFKGYKHLRKDRSHAMKQKYRKKNGGGMSIIGKVLK